jgi:hypothetical protein
MLKISEFGYLFFIHASLVFWGSLIWTLPYTKDILVRCGESVDDRTGKISLVVVVA